MTRCVRGFCKQAAVITQAVVTQLHFLEHLMMRLMMMCIITKGRDRVTGHDKAG